MVWWLIAGLLGLMLLHQLGYIGVPAGIQNVQTPGFVIDPATGNLVQGANFLNPAMMQAMAAHGQAVHASVPNSDDPNAQGGLTAQTSGWHLVSTQAAAAPPPPPPTIGLKQ